MDDKSLNAAGQSDSGNNNIRIPDHAAWVIDCLKRAGYEAYVVGGCVRDLFLGKEPHDWDITTSALPEQVKAVFKKTIDTGIEHGTVTVLTRSEPVEITTYRVDGEYRDGRHPEKVTFTRSLKEDLKRRDFTINAMAYNDTDGLVDLFGGRDDLKNCVIRAVGDPAERFSEDALRMMRAVRFAGQLGFSIDPATRQAITELCENLRLISAERIQAELVKLLTSPHPEMIRDMYETGLTKIFLPEFDRAMETEQNNPHHMYSVGEHTIVGICNVEPDKVLRLTMLFHDLGKPDMKTTDDNGIDHFHGHPARSAEIARKRLRELKFDNATTEDVETLARVHDIRPEASEKSVRKHLSKLGDRRFELLMKVMKADILAQSRYFQKEKLEQLSDLFTIYEKVMADKHCFSIKDLAIGGNDLLEIGYPKGPALGKELNKLLETVLDDPGKNTRDTLLKLAKEDVLSSS